MSKPTRYHKIAIWLHWAIAILILLMIPFGFWMHDAPASMKLNVYQFHKTIGLLILLLSLIRIGWRIVNPPPKMVRTLKLWERGLSHLVHLAFYLFMLAMPLIGWFIVSTSSRGTPTMLFGKINWPHLGFLQNMEAVSRKQWHHLFEEMHELLAFGILALVALHVIAAVKHQLLDKDETMARMVPPLLHRAKPPAAKGRGLFWIIGAVLILFATWIAMGTNTQPHTKAQANAPSTWAKEYPANWTVDKAQSQIRFSFVHNKKPGSGRIQDWAAKINFDPDDISHAQIIVRMKTESAHTGNTEQDQSLPAPGWLDALDHPLIFWKSDQISQHTPGQYLAKGTLDLRGVHVPLDLPFSLEIDADGRAHMHGKTSIQRLAFGIGLADDAYGEWVDDLIQIEIKLTADPQNTSDHPH